LPTDDWHEGGIERTLVEIDAKAVSELDVAVVGLAEGGSLDDAEDKWLQLLAAQRYGVEWQEATFAVHTVRLTDAASSGPHTIAVGQLWFTNAAGLRFTNTTGGTLDAGSTLDISVQAESPGSAYNVGLGTITNMLTPLPGVTATNTALTTSATDDETDAALRQRCRDSLAQRGPGAVAGAYRNWAQEADDEVTRVSVDGGPTPGTVDVIIAGASGSLGSGVVDAVQAYIDERVPLTVEADVRSAAALEIALVGTVYVTAANLAAAEAEGVALIEELQRETDIGGSALGGGASGVSRTEIIERLMRPTGVKNLALTSPAGDTALDTNEVPTFTTVGLSWEAL
jgi:uncharacterized phage protein gp47/JayE